ncbi:M14 family metallopeptidase [Ethanoligenens harbinense]|uniref:Succinylglutamate desuccinylase/aspartoacylase n=1 Tax=Ethanoligenens harbinense (strain DSM 18485 / JCM 12961 / CGMCC 1.5033 / YUAN-3) TaxID=663278 RepID=E6U6T0_ETHHY|nr:M14 family metallopeptidase [Ethanoligenens harbinense]ADU25813.1 Succinylglutamate desuccinylase/aspartoacylase [Ethanoligenens harbinense YUAN-3]
MIKKVETVSRTCLPVDEMLCIRRCRYLPGNLTEDAIAGLPRISLVTGVHGDELEGQFTCYELGSQLAQHPEGLTGVVDIYPAINPLGIESIRRGVPGFNVEMNRLFPGNPDGFIVEKVAGEVLESLVGSDLVVDIHASNIFLRELPQARINENDAETLTPLASRLNLDFLWIHPSATVLESTLAHSLNARDTRCIVVEMGVGMRITRTYGHQLVRGIFNVMRALGIWNIPDAGMDTPHKTLCSLERGVYFLNAEASGIFVPRVEHCAIMEKGEEIGRILDPLTCTVQERIIAPCSGLVFTLREYPVVYTGSLIARMIEGVEDYQLRI